MAKPIGIIGGGLAGLTLGIGLRLSGIPVTIWEAGRYPRHRVCGEFISGRGQETLDRLGLRELVIRAGATTAQTAQFFWINACAPARQMPQPALCLSRFVLDDLLAKQFRELGGEVCENERRLENKDSEGVVRASGRRLRPTENGWRWFGLKVHARNVRLAADLEMHVSQPGYVGFCRLSAGEVNVCGLFRRRVGAAETMRTGLDLLRGEPGTVLNQRLATAEFDESSFCSVAGLCLKPQRASDRTECCIGDALTMIPPVTGNGMSMAFESAEMAIGPLAAYSRGENSWTQAQKRIARLCDRAFSRRLAWAKFLQWLMFAPALQNGLGSMALRSDWFWRMMFTKTR
jgi:2-polyprenyl-6-methoxyphenol hydroxylase-like FAD-dependent oxidoreductase